MKKTKVVCKKQFKLFEGVLDLGDEVVLEPKYSKVGYDRETSNKLTGKKYCHGIAIEMCTGYQFKSKNGNYYDDSWIKNMIGYKALSDIFNKVL